MQNLHKIGWHSCIVARVMILLFTYNCTKSQAPSCILALLLLMPAAMLYSLIVHNIHRIIKTRVSAQSIRQYKQSMSYNFLWTIKNQTWVTILFLPHFGVYYLFLYDSMRGNIRLLLLFDDLLPLLLVTVLLNRNPRLNDFMYSQRITVTVQLYIAAGISESTSNASIEVGAIIA